MSDILSQISKPLVLYRKVETGIPQGQCDCNCDCACSTPELREEYWTSLDVEEGTRFLKNPNLYCDQIDKNHVLVFNPYSEIGVVVVNLVALDILNAFCEPVPLSHIKRRFKHFDELHVDTAMLRFVQLSLLIEEGQSVRVKPRSSNILNIWMHVTNECNLRCTYCYLNKTPDQMSKSTGERSVDAIFRSVNSHGFEGVKIKFSGGEASLNFGLVLHLHDYTRIVADRNNISLDSVVLSNGIALTNKMINEMRQRKMRVMISLDGIGESHDAQRVFLNGEGSFEIVSKTIHRLIDNELIPDISITITEKNARDLENTIRYLLDRDLPFSLNFYRENERSVSHEGLRFSDDRIINGMKNAFRVIKEDLPKRSLLGGIIDRAYFTNLHKRTCGVGENYLVIDQSGQIAKCQMAITNIITNIDAMDPVQIIREDQIGIQNISVEEKEGCKNCTWRYWCTGGCPLYTYRETGRYDVKSPNCRIYKALYPEVLRLEALRILKYADESFHSQN
jgi:uncharacterized protein